MCGSRNSRRVGTPRDSPPGANRPIGRITPSGGSGPIRRIDPFERPLWQADPSMEPLVPLADQARRDHRGRRGQPGPLPANRSASRVTPRGESALRREASPWGRSARIRRVDPRQAGIRRVAPRRVARRAQGRSARPRGADRRGPCGSGVQDLFGAGPCRQAAASA